MSQPVYFPVPGLRLRICPRGFPQLELAIKLIRQTLEEQHSEDELLELRGIHLAAQDVSGLQKKRFKLGYCDFFSGQDGFLWPLQFPVASSPVPHPQVFIRIFRIAQA